MPRRSLVLAAVLSLFIFGCMPPGGVKKVVVYPGLESSGKLIGYLEVWVPTSFGMWMKDLEEGPSTCDTFRIWAGGMGDDEYLGITKVLAWPGTLGNIKYRPIADNFSVTRFPMPVGRHDLYVAAGIECYPSDIQNKFATGAYGGPGYVGTSYSVPVFPMEVDVPPNAIRLYKLALMREEDEFIVSQQWSDTLLPVPENPKKMDPDPNSYSALVRMLDDGDWGFRWYAAKRLRFIGDRSTVPIIQEHLKVETHKDVRNELEKALEKLGK